MCPHSTAVLSVVAARQLSSESGAADRSTSMMHQVPTSTGKCVHMHMCVCVCMHACACVRVCMCGFECDGIVHLSLSLRMFDSSCL